MFLNINKTALAILIMASGISAASAQIVQVNITATTEPTACVPTLTRGGVIDYGNIKANTLSQDAYTVLPEKNVDFSVRCDAPARVAIRAVNDRPGSMAGVTENAAGIAPAPVALFNQSNWVGAGLGMDGTSRIGGYGLRIDSSSATADGQGVSGIYNTAESFTTPWIDSPGGNLYGTVGVHSLSWAMPGSLDPVVATTFAGRISVQAYINRASQLDLSHAVHLDGQTTLELHYP